MQRKRECLFKVGDVVTVIRSSYGRDQLSITRVREIKKPFLLLADGSKWQVDGSGPYPAKHGRYSFSYSRIEPATKEHADTIKRERLISLFGRFDWSSLDLATLKQIAALLPKEDDNG